MRLKSYRYIPLRTFLFISPFVLLCGASQATLTAQVTQIVNAASMMEGPVAPGSIITIKGANLAKTIAKAPDASNPPVTLGGTKVTCGGVAATLFYVSPTQINAVLASNTPTGTVPLVITSDTGTFTTNITINTSAAPGLFSLFGNGVHDGAIINALTYQTGPFSLNPNGPTYLSLYATGVDVSTTPTVTIGGLPAQVTFAGNAPCCAGLQQINVIVPASLAGAGRVPIVITAGGKTSNVVEIVVLPAKGQGPFSGHEDDQANSREIASLAYVPGTSLVLLTDENDDVARVIDVSAQKVVKTIALPQDAEPVAAGATATGKLAAVVERNRGRVAVIDLATNTVLGEVAVGNGPVAVAIAGNTAIVANEGSNTITFVDLVSKTVIRTVNVGTAPRAIATDTTRVYVANENAGTISVVDIATGNTLKTYTLGANTRPTAIQVIPASNLAVITDAAGGASGGVIVLNLTSGATTTVDVNVQHSGGVNDVALAGTNLYFANQAGGSISIVPVSALQAGGTVTPTTLKVGLGARALAVDTKDNVLLVTNEGSGQVVLIDLVKNTILARIDGIRSEDEDTDNDDHGDRDHAANAPTVSSVVPASAKAGSSFTLTINGTNLSGASDVIFVVPSSNPGKGKGKGNGNSGNHGNGASDTRDAAFTVSNVQVNPAGTQLTANVAVAANAAVGQRIVRVLTPNGESTFKSSMANTITVTQ